MADPRMQEAFRRAIMQAPQGEPELVEQQMGIEDEERYRMALSASENQPQALGGPSIEEQEAALIDEQVHNLAMAYDPQVQAQRYRDALRDQVNQRVVAVFGQEMPVHGSLMVLPNGATVDLDNPDQVMMFIDHLEDLQGPEQAMPPATPVPQQMPAQGPQPQQQRRQAGPESPPVPAGASVARR